MTPPLPAVPVKPSEIEGSGVFADRLLTQGEIILHLDGSRLITDERFVNKDANHMAKAKAHHRSPTSSI